MSSVVASVRPFESAVDTVTVEPTFRSPFVRLVPRR